MTAIPEPRRGWIAVAVLLLISAVYYGLYLNAGFNAADDGNYAQIAYELLLGRAPADIAFGYGLLWFKIGEGLFRLFGVNFLLVRLLFFTCIALTNVLIFCTLRRVSGSTWYAALFTAVTLIVPAFPATASYGLCVALNAAAQMRFAARIAQASRGHAALAGAALGLTFQIRPDFGFVFAVPLVVLILLARPSRRSALAALAGVVGASLPFFLCAAIGGYVGSLVHEYVAYPALMFEYVLNGLRGAQGGGFAVLQRPGLGNAPMAALVYAPLVFILVQTSIVAVNVVRPAATRDNATTGQTFVALVAGVAAFPYYFLFRPDISHVANFMPGFIVMTGVLLAQARLTPWRAWLAPVCAAGLTAYLALYVWIGLTVPGTGSIEVLSGRTERFRAANGVDVRVTPAEKAQLDVVRAAITAHTAPREAIVCLPYCPGFAFMTARRMLLSAFYADEAFLVRKPAWLPETIALTQTVRPPIVIVADWAINGTEHSRFVNWAAPYVAAVDSLAQDRIKDADLTIYVLKTSAVETR